MGAVSFAIKYRHWIGYGLAVVALVFCVWYIHNEGYKACEQDAIVKQATSNNKAIETRKEIEHESKNFNRDELIDDLRIHGELRDEADL